MDESAPIAIVVPCYNEAARLREDEFLRFLERHSEIVFLFVDDGSTDATPTRLDALQKKSAGRAQVLRLPENRGKAEAIRAGFAEAFHLGAGWIGYWDADLATPLAAILDLARHAKTCTARAVFGSRVKLLGRKIRRRPLRHYLGRCFATVVSVLLGIDVYDTQCGAKLFANDEIVRQAFVRPFTTRWIFDVELLARLLVSARRMEPGRPPGARMVEVPLEAWDDVAGSKLKTTDFLKAFVDLLRIARQYWPDLRG